MSVSPWSSAGRLTQNAIWVDLKGKDAVPDTVHHAMVMVDPANHPGGWAELEPPAPTDNIHALDDVSGDGGTGKEAESEVGTTRRLTVDLPANGRLIIDVKKKKKKLFFTTTIICMLSTSGGENTGKNRGKNPN